MTETIWSGELELTAPSLPLQPPRTADGGAFAAARLLVRVAGTPIGFVEVETRDGLIGVEDAVARAQYQLGDEIDRERRADDHEPRNGTPALADDRPRCPTWLTEDTGLVSIVVCTRNRPEGLMRCIDALRALRYRDTEIVIVDNAPDDDRSAEVVDAVSRIDGRVRYVREDRPGLSCARNRGLEEATGELVAFTDDDVRVDRLWLDGVMRGFARDPRVACVTGLVASASLEHRAEQYFDGRVSWSSDCEHALYLREPPAGGSRLHPYASGVFGTGANIAFRMASLQAIGGFDECLGAGSPTGGGEDLDIFVRVLRAGFALSYEPSALVWHDHRVSEDSLRAQMFGYGKGLGAYLTKYLISPRTRTEVGGRLLIGLAHAATLARRSSATSERSGVQSGLLAAELRGLAQGPGAYLRARRAVGPAHTARVAP